MVKVYPKFFFYQENTNNLLHLNNCYKFIWEDFDSEQEAYEALNDLGFMLFDRFAGAVNVTLELRKKYVVKTDYHD